MNTIQIIVQGGEGAGKSTVARAVSEALSALGFNVMQDHGIDGDPKLSANRHKKILHDLTEVQQTQVHVYENQRR